MPGRRCARRWRTAWHTHPSPNFHGWLTLHITSAIDSLIFVLMLMFCRCHSFTYTGHPAPTFSSRCASSCFTSLVSRPWTNGMLILMARRVRPSCRISSSSQSFLMYTPRTLWSSFFLSIHRNISCPSDSFFKPSSIWCFTMNLCSEIGSVRCTFTISNHPSAGALVCSHHRRSVTFHVTSSASSLNLTTVSPYTRRRRRHEATLTAPTW